MDDQFKGNEGVNNCLEKHPEFKEKIYNFINSGNIRFFDDREWEVIKKQNFSSPVPEMSNFYDMFRLGYNFGNCTGAAWQLSYSYNNVDIVYGWLPILTGTRNSENGKHCWLETKTHIIDTSLLLVIDKNLKNEIGYVENQRVTSYELSSFSYYQIRKDYVNDESIRSK